jgi:hypothetical protein
MLAPTDPSAIVSILARPKKPAGVIRAGQVRERRQAPEALGAENKRPKKLIAGRDLEMENNRQTGQE